MNVNIPDVLVVIDQFLRDLKFLGFIKDLFEKDNYPLKIPFLSHKCREWALEIFNRIFKRENLSLEETVKEKEEKETEEAKEEVNYEFAKCTITSAAYYHDGDCTPNEDKCTLCWKYFCISCGKGSNSGGIVDRCCQKDRKRDVIFPKTEEEWNPIKWVTEVSKEAEEWKPNKWVVQKQSPEEKGSDYYYSGNIKYFRLRNTNISGTSTETNWGKRKVIPSKCNNQHFHQNKSSQEKQKMMKHYLLSQMNEPLSLDFYHGLNNFLNHLSIPKKLWREWLKNHTNDCHCRPSRDNDNWTPFGTVWKEKS